MSRAAVIRTCLAGALAGVVLATVLAALLPRTEPSLAAQDRPADPLAPTPAPAGDPRRPAVAPRRPHPRGSGFVRVRAAGPVRIEARIDDPLGGPGWAVRVFLAERRADGNVIGRPRCAQLGRIHQGRFGWVDATNTFRPVPVGYFGAPIECVSVTPDLRRRPYIDVRTRITDPTPGAAEPIQTFAWGLTGRDGKVVIRAGGRTLTPPRTRNGAFVAALPASVERTEVEVRYPTGPPITEARTARADIEYRVPDPHGGLPWGLQAVPARRGGWCTGWPARIVGDRVGGIDYQLGTLTETSGHLTGACPDARQPPSRARPLNVGWSGGGGFAGEPGQDPLPGRVARRTLRGITTIAGIAHPDVRSITVATPRDVRTISPSPRAHAFVLLYDGSFPTGDAVLTATFADGSTQRETLPMGFP
jgi:hypothetical protein